MGIIAAGDNEELFCEFNFFAADFVGLIGINWFKNVIDKIGEIILHEDFSFC